MQSSETPSNSSEPPHQKWAGILGSVIAVLTLTVPLIAIAYYSSSSNNIELAPKNIYAIPKPEK